MLDRNVSGIRLSFDRHEVALFRFDIHLVAIAKRDFQKKRPASLIRTELDTRDRPDRHLSMDSPVMVREHGVSTAAVDEPIKFGATDGNRRSVIQTDEDRLSRSCGRRRLQKQQQ
jgi:hypothetical protein